MKRLKMWLREAEALSTVASLALLFSVADCTTTQQTLANSIITQVQSYANNLCKFVPDAATVIAMWNATVAAAVATVSTEVCDVVDAIPPITPTVSAKLRSNPPFANVGGKLILVHGTWTGGPNAGRKI